MTIWRFAALGALGAVLCAAIARADDAEETFGCEANPTGDPIGGGSGYREIRTTGDFIVKTKAELLGALKEAKLLKTLEGHRSWVGAVALSGDGRHALSTGYDSRLLRWDLETGQIVTEMANKRKHYAIVSNADGTRAYAAGDNYGIACSDTTSGKLLRELRGHGRPVRALAISPDGKTFVTASEDTTLLVWEVF